MEDPCMAYGEDALCESFTEGDTAATRSGGSHWVACWTGIAAGATGAGVLVSSVPAEDGMSLAVAGPTFAEDLRLFALCARNWLVSKGLGG